MLRKYVVAGLVFSTLLLFGGMLFAEAQSQEVTQIKVYKTPS